MVSEERLTVVKVLLALLRKTTVTGEEPEVSTGFGEIEISVAVIIDPGDVVAGAIGHGEVLVNEGGVAVVAKDGGEGNATAGEGDIKIAIIVRIRPRRWRR